MDLISRQAAIDAIQKAYVDTEGGEDRHAAWLNVGLTNALHIMQDLPSAQPEPCGDAVGRDAVVRFLDDWISALDANCHHQSMADLKIVKNDFKNLPSAQPMRWIPCSERMPELPFEEHGIDHDAYKVGDTVVDDWYESEYVLCTNTDLCIAVGKVCRHVTTSPDGKELENRVLFEPASKYDGFIDIEEIIAWMPLPEPWKGDAE